MSYEIGANFSFAFTIKSCLELSTPQTVGARLYSSASGVLLQNFLVCRHNNSILNNNFRDQGRTLNT